MSGTAGSGHGLVRTGGPSISVLIDIGYLPRCVGGRPGSRRHAPGQHDPSLAATASAAHREKPWILGTRAFRCPHRVDPETLRWRIGGIMAEAVVLINAFEVPPGDAENFIAAWEKTRDYLQTQPGYVDTALHQAARPDAEFQFVNIARWRTADDFMAATQSPGFRESAAGTAGYRSHPALYRVVRS